VIVRAAAIQAETTPDLDAALDRTGVLTREAAQRGARLIVFPETWIPGYPAWLDVCRDAGRWDHPPVKAEFRRIAENRVAVPGPATDVIAAIAREASVTIVVGVTERVPGGPGAGTLFNSLLILGPDGDLLVHHRKLVPTYTERLIWGPGDAAGLHVAATPAGRIGGLICWEHWMPLARQVLHDDAEDIHAALWPTVKDINLIACRQYAVEGRCFVIAAGSLMRASALPQSLTPHPDLVSGPDQLVLRGGSAIISPRGDVLAGPVFDEETILVADLDLDHIIEERMNLDVAGHYSRPDCFRLDVVRSRR
jgi:predicted amidohydrolase